MEYLIVCPVAFLASAMTLFSGFGLGVILLPAFALFFPLPIAVALTAIVHFLNNLFKLSLLYKHANKSVVLRFGLLAMPASYLGALSLSRLSNIQPLVSYEVFSHSFQVMPMNLIIAILMIFFALWEIVPRLEKITFDRKYLPLGGVLSGFFGGLSGQQGALRTAFLIRSGLTKEGFIASGVVIACMVDIVRIPVYISSFSQLETNKNLSLLIAATLSAFLGAFIANRWLKKVKMKVIQILVSIMLFGVAAALGMGFI
jgi:uncharacterized protein